MNRTFTAALFVITSITFFKSQAQFLDTASGPRLWLRADKPGTKPLTWQDASGHGKNATATSGQFPTSGSYMNYNPVLTFDGADDYLQLPVATEGLTGFSVIAVFSTPDTTERGIWGTEKSTTRTAWATTRKMSGPDSLPDSYGKFENMPYTGTDIQTWITDTAPADSAYMSLGTNGKTLTYKIFKGQLAEFLFYDRAISFTERAQAETYLGIKYGTGSTGHNYLSSDAQTVYWGANKNSGYANHITGIGRDDGYGLYQKQSQSLYDTGLLTMYTGSMLAANNAANTSAFNSGNVWVWGDNAAALRDKTGTGKDSILSVTQRHWAVQVSGSTASKTKTVLQLDITRLPKSTEGFWLIIDRSGSGDFSADNVEYIKASSTGATTATYSVQWDTDGSGTDMFAFARAKSFFAVVKKLGSPTCFDAKAGDVLVELVAGKAPFSYTLQGTSNGNSRTQRTWTGSAAQNEEKFLTAGDYSVTIADNSNNKTIRTFTLYAPLQLTVDLGPDQKLNGTQPIQLNAAQYIPDSVAVSYAWEGSFGFSSTNPQVSIDSAGIYTVTVTRARDGCPFTSTITINGSGVDKSAVFPVPVAQGQPLKMSVSLQEPGTVAVTILNSSGETVQQLQGDGNSEYEFMSPLPGAGMYIVVIQTPKGRETYKVIAD